MITAFIGDGEKPLHLPPPLIKELEKLAGNSIGDLYSRVLGGRFYYSDLITITRLGLIGGGMSDRAAYELVETYVQPKPIMQILPPVLDLLEVVWSGETLSEAMTADAAGSATDDDGSLQAALNDSLQEIAP